MKQLVKEKARQLGFSLAGVASCKPLEHYEFFKYWLDADYHGTMQYLAEERSRSRRADPKQILPECKSILVLAYPYAPPVNNVSENNTGKIASYAIGDDYHDVIPPKLKEIIDYLESQIGHSVPNRYYTDTGPILERELAQRAGLGWFGKNSMLIHPKQGSYFLLAEILIGIDLEPDSPFPTDHCGTCTRCIDACPTQCILPNRTLDARRCISYLTIELKDNIPEDIRPLMQNWVFGCDICQEVCPWNRFAPRSEFAESKIPLRVLTEELDTTSQSFNQRFKGSPIKRTKRRGYLRNVAVAIGNAGTPKDIPVLEKAMQDDEPMVREHAKWARDAILKRENHE